MISAELQSRIAELARQAQVEPLRAQRTFAEFLDELPVQSPSPGDAVLLLEESRPVLERIQEEFSGEYVNRALPLSSEEGETFSRTVALWRKMAGAYAACQAPEDDAGRSLILHRCLHFTSLAIFEHFRARSVVADGLWLELHRYYEMAESRSLAHVPVPDPVDPEGQRSDCAAVFTAILLTDAAAPYGLGSRDLAAIRRWALRWAPLVGVLKLGEDGASPEFIVDLARDTGLHPPGQRLTDEVRRLESGRLVEAMRLAEASLRDRVPPAELGLGDDVTAGQCRRLLAALAKPWAQTVVPRRFKRRPATGVVLVGMGFEAIHYFVTGKVFRQPEGFRVFSRSEYESLFVFREMIEPKREFAAREYRDGYEPEQWSVGNESATGFRLFRSRPGQRVSHGQLLAICPHDGERFLLAEVCWLMHEEQQALAIGVALLPGIPEGIACRRVGGSGNIERFSQALMLPGSPVGGGPSLVLPRGWFVPGRSLEVGDNSSHFRRLRMLAVIRTGTDFEQVNFEPAD